MIQNFVQQPLKISSFNPRRRRLHRQRPRPERLGLKSIARQLFPDLSKHRLLRRSQFDDQRQQQRLRLHRAPRSLPQHPLEQHPLMRHVLVDDPQPAAIRRHNEGIAHLPQRPQILKRRWAL